MQRDIDFGGDDARDLALDPCATSGIPVACMRYKVRRLFDLSTQLDDARRFCESLEGDIRVGCFHGIGFGAFRQGERDANTINDVCPTDRSTEARVCVEGALGAMAVTRFDDAKEACAVYTGDKGMCIRAILTGRFSMERSFADYYRK